MNRVAFILVIFFFQGAFLYAQEQKIQLKLQEGYEYFFRMQESSYYVNDKNEKTGVINYNKEINVFVTKANTSSIEIEVSFPKIIAEEPEATKPTFIDYRFPSLKINQDIKNSVTLVNEILCRLKLKYSFDLQGNTLQLVNRVEILEEIFSILKSKGMNQNTVSDNVNWLNKKYINQFDKNIKFLFYFKNSSIKNNTLTSTVLNEYFEITSNGSFIEAVKGDSAATSRKVYKHCVLNKDNGIIQTFLKIENKDSIHIIGHRQPGYKYSKFRTSFELIDYREKTKNIAVFKGTFNDVKVKSIVVHHLTNSVITSPEFKTFSIDKDNTCTFQMELIKPGFYFINPENSAISTLSGIILFVCPGDTIEFTLNSDDFSVDPQFFGNHAETNIFLNYLKNNHELFFAYYDSYISFIGFRLQDKKFEMNYKDSDKIIREYLKYHSLSLNKEELKYVLNEIKASEYFNYYSILLLYSRYSHLPSEFTSFVSPETITQIKENINDFNFQNIYNENGFFSRLLANVFLEYNLMGQAIIGVFDELTVQTSIEDRVHARFTQAQLILGGAAYYYEMADYLYKTLISRVQTSQQMGYLKWDFTIEYIDQLLKNTNDNNYHLALKALKEKRVLWDKDNFIPDADFYNKDGEIVKLADAIKSKPTVIYVSNDWARGRYRLDDLATGNPDIRFILIVEGTDLKKWQNYLERAEPIAEQLILISDTISLNNIFLRSDKLYLIYDKQEKLIEYDVSLDEAVKQAQNSLKKKEINKSTLRIIIIVLGILLFTITLILLTGRLRARQRLKKEQQIRRLRELELTAIRSQMNPHFLFNSLNSVQNLIQQNKGREAHLYLSDFAGLIRKVLRNSEKQESSLAEELEMTEQYLNLEKLRFDFEYTISVDEEIDLQNTMIPSMLLQPFAENAVVHGLQNKTSDRKLKIEILHVDNVFKIIIEDNGIGRKAAKKIEAEKNGKGIKMNRERLELLREKYGEKYQLLITDLEKGTRVEIIIPEEK